MSGQDLMQQMAEITRLLDAAVREYKTRGGVAARAEHDYRIERAKCTLRLREDNIPATLIPDLCRGDKQVAKLKLDWDIKLAEYEAAQAAINSFKLQLRILNDMAGREWNS